MDKNLQDLYMEKYQRTAPVLEQSTDKSDETVVEEATQTKKTVKTKSKTVAESNAFNDVFGDILKTLNEEFGEGSADDTMDFDDGQEDFGGEDEEISVSKSVIQSIIDQLQGLIGDVGYDDDMGGDDDFGGDDIPLESYGFEGAGQHVGAQANYSGKAGLLPATDLVDANGNIRKNKVKVGGKPTKGHNSEGQHHGAQGNYDGKAKRQSPSTHVKSNGDADFGKNKTGYGKAKGEDLF